MNTKTVKDETVWETSLSLPLINRGKVRDIYAVGDDKLLIVTSDRLSAFDVVLPTPIPRKGKVLNQISLFWFEKFSGLVSNHIITSELNNAGFDQDFLARHGSALAGRFVLVHRAKPLPIECVVRGFLAGSGWKDYQKTGKVCGHALRPGLRQSEELLEPIFTPATNATVGHDENISFDEAANLVGKDLAQEVRKISVQLYKEGVKYAKTRGILIADTKFEFGLLNDKLILIDEVLTPDSSRFWPMETYKPDQDQPSLDKQIVRDFLEKSGWDKTPPGPVLPQKIAEKTSNAYVDVYKRLTGKDLL
jgi:phosphoribosylaminoimidazole-succinocarboxamide synthase